MEKNTLNEQKTSPLNCDYGAEHKLDLSTNNVIVTDKLCRPTWDFTTYVSQEDGSFTLISCYFRFVNMGNASVILLQSSHGRKTVLKCQTDY